MDIAIRAFNYVWFNTFGYEEHVAAKGRLAIDNAHRAVRKAERVIGRVRRALDDKPGALILR